MQARSVSAYNLSGAPVVPFGCRVIVGIGIVGRMAMLCELGVQLSLRLRRQIAWPEERRVHPYGA